MEKHYVVIWKIDEWASSPLEAVQKAIKALPHERNEESIATVFDVEEINGSGKVVRTIQIDALEEGSNPFNDEDLKKAETEIHESWIVS
jgi:hypothetical protein